MAPIHVGGCGQISRKCVGLVASDATRWLQTVNSSLTGGGRLIFCPFAFFNTCCRINLTHPVKEELTVWRHLVTSLATRPTHLWEIRPHPPTWISATDASLTGMGGVCHSPNGDWHVWRLTFSTDIRANILIDKKPAGLLTINDLKLAAYIAHLHLFAPRMAPLEKNSTGVDNTAAESWACQGSVSTATTIGPLLRESVWITRQAKIHASIKRIPGVENIKADAASRLTHMPVHAFLKSFNTYVEQ